MRSTPPTLLLAASGAVGLTYELVWIRRLSLVLGGSAVASAVGVAAWMGGMALGGWLIGRRKAAFAHPWRVYAGLEATAAVWALSFPLGQEALFRASVDAPALRWPLALFLVGAPATVLGATWPVLAERSSASRAGTLYAANTFGAVVGVLICTFVAMPALGVRGTELMAAGVALLVAWLAWRGGGPAMDLDPVPWRADPGLLGLAGVAGFSAIGLEVVWMRLAAIAFGSTVQTVGGVLAAFLVLVATGAAIGTRLRGDLDRWIGATMGAMGMLALLGALLWGQLPYLLAGAWRLGGAPMLLPASVVLALLGMGGAPLASGAVFTLLVRRSGPDGRGGGALAAANTLGAVLGALIGGLWAVRALGVGGAVIAFALLAALGGAWRSKRVTALVLCALLAWLQPPWDGRLYAVGLHLRISDFADPSAQALHRFVDDGWDLISYEQGATAAVAVGRSRATGNVWLSLNGKVDASTGDDMPTQVLSGEIPIRWHPDPQRVAVVGLASGVTAGAVLADPRVQSLDLLELEPAVVAASHAFDHVNGRPLNDPRTRLIIDDARAWLARQEPFDVIVSEPSNPWISGVSNLFTEEYWTMARGKIAPGGIFAQWVQLYGMGPDEVRGILRTFTHVFGDVWVFETIPGTDLLLVAVSGPLPPDLPLAPTLTPDQLRCVVGTGWLNTDDRPRVEWRAPAYLHYETTTANRAMLSAGCPSKPAE